MTAFRIADARRVLVSSVIGSVIEWYDYALYGTAAALVFNSAFFPNFSPAAAVVASYGTFAVGFVARPVGGLVAGHLGDRFGRKATLVLTLTSMGLATTLIGALPTFAQIGLWAPALLVLLRLVQGFAVGGEWGGAVLMAVEFAPPGKRGLWGSWPQTGVSAGLVLGAAAFSVMAAVTTPQAFVAWGWRVPFLISFVLAGVGLFIRFRTLESPAFAAMLAAGALAKRPLPEMLRGHWRQVLRTFGARFPDGSNYYLFTVFILSFATMQAHIARADAINCVMAGAAVNAVTIPLWGALSDRVGRRPVFVGGALFMAAFAWPFYALIQTGSAWAMAVALIVMLNFGHAAVYGPLASYLAELFPPRVRFSGISLGYQVGSTVLSGAMPLLASALMVWSSGSAWPLVALTAVTALIGAAVVGLGPETRGRS